MSDSLVDGVSGRLLTDKQHSPRHEPDLDVAGPTVRHDLDHSAGSGPHAHSVPSQGDIGDKETRDHFYSIHPPADHLNYRQTTQPLAQDRQDLPAKISHLDQPRHSEQAADAEQDSYFRPHAHAEQEPDSEHGTQPECDTLQEHRTHSWQDSLSEQETDSEYDTQPEYDIQPQNDTQREHDTQPEHDTQSQHDTAPQHGTQPEHGMRSGQDMQKETLSPSSSFSNTNAKWTAKRLRLRSGAKGIDIDRRLEESHEQTSPKVTSPKMGLPRSCKRKRGQDGDLTQLAGRFGSVNVHEEMEEMEEMEERYSQLSEQARNRILGNLPRQSDF
jgi:hypothetical protein